MANKVVLIDVSSADEDAALTACKSLCRAYDLGESRGGSMDWSDVETAVDKALEAIPGARESVESAREALNDDDVEFDDIEIKWEGETSQAVHACLLMIHSARFEDGSEWEDVDMAWEASKQALGQVSAPKP